MATGGASPSFPSFLPLGPGFAGQHYAVLGLARSGLATVGALVAAGARVSAWDDRAEARDAGAALGATIADLMAMELAALDGLVLSPGVPLNRHPLAQRARDAGVSILGDIELFARARAHLPPHKVVGITGTNGKSTTTALIHHILQTAGIPSLMGGNIGLPILSQAPLPAGGVYVLELSSYQIDLTHSLDCDVAVLLNVTPDHLDRYDGSFEAYAASKARLFEMQTERNHFAVIANDDEPSRKIFLREWFRRMPPENLVLVRAEIAPMDQACWPTLQGPHNTQNAVCAIAACKALGLTETQIATGVRTYPGLPHRMERIAEIGGVLFVNDSKATNPASVAPALAAYPLVDGRARIHWILGGLAKGDGLEECEDWLAHVARAYLIGDAAPQFARALGQRVDAVHSGTLDAAVAAAAAAAQPGDVVLLSPAAASFDQFRDFEARGDAFRAAVRALQQAGQQGGGA